MVNLRCSKCGSHAGFLIETSNGKTLEIPGQIGVERIKATVRVTCTYCNNLWDHAPISLIDKELEERVGARVTA